jgi:hypothetical protein
MLASAMAVGLGVARVVPVNAVHLPAGRALDGERRAVERPVAGFADFGVRAVDGAEPSRIVGCGGFRGGDRLRLDVSVKKHSECPFNVLSTDKRTITKS